MPVLPFTLAVAASIGCGLMAGLFFSFSHFIMQALGSRPAAEGMPAMQAINVKILTPWFLLLFLGTGVLCVALIIRLLTSAPPSGTFWLLLGCGCYLVGCLLITMVFNVPLNNRLAAADPHSAEGQALWQHYLGVWTAWNHVRSVLTAGGLGAFIVGLAKSGFPG